MKKEGGFLLLGFFIVLNFSILEKNTYVYAAENENKFLNIPFSHKITLLQGWVYADGDIAGKTHYAADYRCTLGDRIYAAESGLAMHSVQARMGRGHTFGNFVFIKHDNGFATLYGHLNKANEEIKSYPENKRTNIDYFEWTPVKKGEYIGECGKSGTDAAHLHFEVSRGKYALDRVDSYDLYTTKQFYPPNASFTAMGEKHVWTSEPPSFNGEVKNNSTQKEVVSIVHEEQREGEGDIPLDIRFENDLFEVSAEPDVEIPVVVPIQNMGQKVLIGKELSLNVIGGAKENEKFRHKSWLTALRPALLNESEVKPGQKGSFKFMVKALVPGSYTLKLMIVRVGTWEQIGDKAVTIQITVGKKTEVPHVETVTSTGKTNKSLLNGIVQGVKEFTENVVDTVVDVFKSIPKFFSGGGTSAPVVTQKETGTEDDDVSEMYEDQDNPTSTTTIDVILPDRPTLEMVKRTVTTTQLSWIVTSTDLKEFKYTIEQKRDNGEWEELLSNTTNTSYKWEGELFHAYTLRVNARDYVGNVSEWSNEITITTGWENKVILNEIAWAGASSVCAAKQWIELYNTTDESISLQNWRIEIHGADSAVSLPLTNTVQGHGYYLISHTGVFPSTLVPDQNLSSSIKLPATGVRLILRDEKGNIQDEIDQRTGWSGGSGGAYPHTLERISVQTPSFVSVNWQSSNSVRYGLRTGNCGYLTGSPGMQNSGYAYFSDETRGFYPTDGSGEIMLPKEEGPYLWSSFTIAPREKMSIPGGSVMIGVDSGSRIVVKGELTIQGTEEQKIVFTSRNDREIVDQHEAFADILLTDLPKAGDWQNIEVHEVGKVSAEHVLFKYGGNRHASIMGCGGGCYRSQVISNFGGDVELRNVEIGYGYEAGNQSSIPDTLVYSDKGSLSLTVVNLHHGKRAIHITPNTGIMGLSLSFDNFELEDKVVYFDQTMPDVWEEIHFGESSPGYAYNPSLMVTSSFELAPGKKFLFGTISVETGGTLTVDNNNLYANSIRIYGTLQMNADEQGYEIAGDPSLASKFSYIFFGPGSIGNIARVTIRGGGYFPNINTYPLSSNQPFMVWIDGGHVAISDSELRDIRRPGGVITVKNGGELDVRDSKIGWYDAYTKQLTWKEYGIVANNASKIHIENTQFSKMDYVVSIVDSDFTYDRITTEHFTDLYPAEMNQKNWLPSTAFPF